MLERQSINLKRLRSKKIAGDAAMTVAEEIRSESRPFEADVAKLLQLMVHSVYSEKSVFLRELISNAADACERLRYEAIAEPALLGDNPTPRITITVDAEQRQLMIEDNGIGMSREELISRLAPSRAPAPRRSSTGWKRPKTTRRRR
jgi:molecular chaperone HtpG